MGGNLPFIRPGLNGEAVPGADYQLKGVEYLFGLLHEERAGEIQFISFRAHDREEERAAFQQAADFATARQRQCSAQIYHYAS